MPNNRPNGYCDPKTGRFIPFSEQNLPVRAQNLPVFAKNPPTRLQKPTKKKRKINLVLLAVFTVLFFVIFVLPFAGNNSDAEDTAETEPARAVESEETDTLTLYQIEASPAQPKPEPDPEPELPAAEPVFEDAAALSEPKPEPILTLTPERDFTGAQEQPEDFYPYLKTYEHEITEQYVLNTSSHKIHKPNCNDVSKIKAENYSTTDDPETWLTWGYTNCGHCGGCG